MIGLGREVFERLNGYRRELGVRTVTEAVERLLAAARERVG